MILRRQAVLLFLSSLIVATAFAQSSPDAIVHVDTTPTHAINSFDPDSALGSSLDVLSRRDIDRVHTPHIVQESLSAGWGPITYRNNSELRMAAWHWNPAGSWSDAAHESGYFTGSTELKSPIRYILSYALPHRGFATSGDRPVQGPNLLYWKSNPYLTSKFTGESDALHPQSVIVDLQSEKQITAARTPGQRVDCSVAARRPSHQERTLKRSTASHSAAGRMLLPGFSLMEAVPLLRLTSTESTPLYFCMATRTA